MEKYFIRQQKDLGVLNGYIEEMMEGQKVVKVFCHEEETKKKFYEHNDGLFDSAKNANIYANILMPVMANLGNINYVITLQLVLFWHQWCGWSDPWCIGILPAADEKL